MPSDFLDSGRWGTRMLNEPTQRMDTHRMTRILRLLAGVVLLQLGIAACASDETGSEAQKRGVGAACNADLPCTEPGQTCLEFKGGYCGVADCKNDAGCPQGSACVAHDDGKNYCFLVCGDKAECNLTRPPEDAANCSSSVSFVEDTNARKACVPPS